MTAILKRILRRAVGSVRVGDFIPVGEDGFWRDRSAPARSLRYAARLFNQLQGDTIIEIGSGLHGRPSGNSILVWSTRTSAKSIIAIDIDAERIREVQKATARHSKVTAILADGIEYLERCPAKIDLLYLDFWTPDPEGTVPGTGRSEAHRRAYRAAKDKMNPQSLILIDDTDHVPPWKHTLLIPEARRDGYWVLYTGRQTLLRR